MTYTFDWEGKSTNGSFSATDGSGTVGLSVTTTPASNGNTTTIGMAGADSGMFVSGISEQVQSTITFAQPVTNLNFWILDIDALTGSWDDRITIIATNGLGQQVPVTWGNLNGLHTATGNQLDADGNASGGVEGIGAADSVQVSIAGPISSLTFLFDNGESFATSGMFGVSDMTFELPDGIVEGTAGADVIDTLYVGDPEGDRIDANDGLGVGGTTGDADYVIAGDGNDSVAAGVGNDIVYGENGDDTLRGGTGDDTLYGGAGNDHLHSEGGSGEQLYGGEGNDTLTSLGSTNSVIDGGDGNDYLYSDGAGNQVSGGAGDDTVFGWTADDSLSGGTGNDLVDGDTGNDSLTGDAGNDTLYGDEGNDTLDGGLGDDTVNGGAGNDTIYGGSDGITASTAPASYVDIHGTSGTVTGTNGNPGYSYSVTSNTGGVFENTQTVQMPMGGSEQMDGYQVGNGNPANEIHTHTFSDEVGNVQLRIVGLNTMETLVFTIDGQVVDLNAALASGLATFDPGTSPIYVDSNGNLAASSDVSTPYVPATLTLHGPLTTLAVQNVSSNGFGNGTLYELSVDTNPAWEVLPDGNDSLTGGDGTDYIVGGSGDDTIAGGADKDSLYGGDGNDSIVGENGADVLYGGGGADQLKGAADADVIYGSAGDTVIGGETTTAGGTDFDTLVLNYADVQSITYGGGNNEAGTVNFYGGDTLTFSEIESIAYIGPVDGTAGNDSIFAGYIDAQGDQVDGTDGVNDTIFGYAGNDAISAGAGNDLVYGGDGDDALVGQAGDDTVYGDAGSDNIALFDGHGSDSVIGGETGEGAFGDTLQISTTTGANVSFTGNETGTATTGSGTVAFSEIETLDLTGLADSVNASSTTSGTWVFGNGGNDTLTGGSGDDRLVGGGDNDFLTGNAGNDSMQGDAGNDELFGGAGADTLAGGDDIDQIYGGDDQDSLFGGAGNDYMQGDAGNDTVDAGIGDDFLRGDAGSDLVYGGDGNDSVYGGADSDQVFGGAGNDQVFGGFGTDTVYGGDGNDTITGSGGSDVVYGDAGNDYMQGSDGSDTMYGGTGNDTILGEEDADVIYGAAGDVVAGGETTTAGGVDYDTLVLNYADVQSITYGGGNNESGTVTFTAASGGGTLTFSEIENIAYTGLVDGTSGNDVMNVGYTDAQGDQIDGTDGINDTILAYDGNDEVYAGSGNDLVDLGAGDDTLGSWTSDAGDDTILGGLGNDSVIAGAGNDSVHGDDGNDMLFGSSGDDTLYGDAGADRLYGGLGNDVGYGGAGNDTLQVVDSDQGETLFGGADVDHVQFSTYSSTSGVSVSLTGAGAGTFDYVSTPAEGSFAEIESFGLTEYNDTFDGSASASSLTVGAGGGNDAVTGGTANDVLSGDAGNDTLTGGAGNDTLMGGNDVDVFYGAAGDSIIGGEGGTDNDTLVLNRADVQSITYGGGNNEAGTVTFYGGGTLNFSEIESIAYDGPVDGTGGDDVMNVGYTDGQGDQIDGTDGNDDTILGYDGNDSITAGVGNDTVYGGAGNDTVLGQGGNDVLQGEGGDDTFVAEDGFGNDTVTGGETGETSGDTLDLSAVSTGVLVDLSQGDPANTEDGTATVAQPVASGEQWVRIFKPSTTITGFGVYPQSTIDFTQGEWFYVKVSDLDSFLDDSQGIGGGGGSMDTTQTYASDLDGLGVVGQSIGSPGLSYYTDANGNSFQVGWVADYYGSGATGVPYQTYLIVTDTSAGGAPVGGSNYAGATSSNASFSYSSFTGPSETITFSEIENIVFGAGNDTIIGSGNADTVAAAGGDDLVYGGAGDDTLNGEAGNDTLFGGVGNDSILGGDGDDRINPVNDDAGNDTVEAGAGNDTVYSGTGDDLVTGGTGNDLVGGGDGSDNISGGTGNDTLTGDAGNDTISGGDDNDYLFGGTGDDNLSGDAGNDTVSANEGNDLVYGGGGDDVISGGVDDDSLYGGTGNDNLQGESGNDVIDGGDGNDSIQGGLGNDIIYGGAGADTLVGDDDRDQFFGTDVGDVIDGGEGGDDYDTLDLSNWGKNNVKITYDSSNPENGTVEFLDGTGAVIGTMTFSNIEKVIPCFTPGTLVATDRGEVRVETLREGDRVLTRDSGYQQIRWIGRRDLSTDDLTAAPKLKPVRIARGALGLNLPDRDLLVSPQHRMLLASTRAELLFGEHEVLVPAIHLTDRPGITQESPGSVTYIHLLFDQHEIVRANGAWSESFQPGALTLAGMDDGPREELLTLFPELKLGTYFPAARITLKKRETQLLMAN